MNPSYLKVLVDGQELKDFYCFEASIVHELNRHPWCVVRYRQVPETRHSFESDIGKPFKILGVDDAGVELEVFDGLVKRVDTEYEMSGACNFYYHGIGHSFILDTFHNCQTFAKMSGPDIAAKLLGGMAGDLQMQAGPLLTLIQYDETDWSFLHRVADRHGAFLRVKGAKIDVFNEYQSDTVELKWRKEGELHLFRTTGQLYASSLNGVNYDRADATSKEYKNVKEPPPAEDSLGALRGAAEDGSSTNGVKDALWGKFLSADHGRFEDELKLEAKRRRIHGCTAVGESKCAELLVGNKVELKGDIEVAGKYGVFKLEHLWSVGSGYFNRFWCMPYKVYLDATRPSPAAVHMPAAAVQAALPAVQAPPAVVQAAPARAPGPVVARVLDNNDPEKLPRVKVEFIWEGAASESGWAPVLMPHAGDGRGVYFIPEVGDEVLVVFEAGDPNRPIVVGSMWDGAAAAPCDDLHGGEYSNNDIKRIVTKSGNRLVFDDKDGQETMVMATPQHIRVSMFEGDQTLLIHSDGDIDIHAGGTVHIKCNQFLREVG